MHGQISFSLFTIPCLIYSPYIPLLSFFFPFLFINSVSLLFLAELYYNPIHHSTSSLFHLVILLGLSFCVILHSFKVPYHNNIISESVLINKEGKYSSADADEKILSD